MAKLPYSWPYVIRILLLSTLIPIIKDKLGDASVSGNYRSIAISSFILKLFDWVTIILCNDSLHLDALQFGYQSGCSPTMCTWAVVESIDYFLRNGSDVYTCMMDMSKAFDHVNHSLLFEKLFNRGMPSIFIRFLIATYRKQTANVKWNGELSNEFQLCNGVKQGAVLSAILYCVCVFLRLRHKHVG